MGCPTSIARLAALALLANHVTGINLTVAAEGGNATSPVMHGFMFEDINHSGDGGIHGQLLRNNGFQGDVHNLTAYGAVGDVDLAVDSDNPLSDAIPYSLAVSVPEGTSGQVGFSNEGYWGITVNTDVYTSFFWIKGDYSGDVTIKLVGISDGFEYASSTVPVTSDSSAYTYVETSFSSTQAPYGDNLWTLTFDGEATAGSTLHFDLVSLYPTSFNRRPNGLKPAIANVLNDMGGKFLRFPGGNNLEGTSEDTRWKWNETIGPLEDRPGRQGAWGYANTDALGLVEYFEWCIDMGLTPVLDVWAGFSLNSGGDTPLTGDALTPYIDDVLDELEFILGDATTYWGGIRSSLGYPSPFALSHVEIGNEDDLGNGCSTYADRFTRIHDAIKAAHPSLILIASNAAPDCLPAQLPEGAWVDYHTYANESSLVANFSQWDNWDRSIPVFVGEFACNGTADGVRPLLPYMGGSVAEAVYMIGFERNADVIQMQAYAPTLQLFNSTQWTPNMIEFNQNPGGVIRSTSYYVQQMFARNFGSTTRAVESDAAFGPVYWSATAGGGTTYLKLANYGPEAQIVSVRVEGAVEGTVTLLYGADRAAANPETGEVIQPVRLTVPVCGDGTMQFQLPAWSVGVLAST